MRDELHFRYRPEIDGLRAIAVMAVLLFHLDLGLAGGYVGVDVFFVISGYLITKLVVRDLAEDGFSILTFWERRVRRIFPALFAMMAVTLVAGYFLLLPWDYEDLGRSVTAMAAFVSNFFFLSQSGYFDGPAELKPLLHTWSLAVEEQFYLLYPALLALLWHRYRPGLQPVLIALWILSFVTSAVGVHQFPEATFYLLPTRAWELLTGALLALNVLPARVPAMVRQILSAVGLSAILAAAFFYHPSTPFPGFAALLPCLGAAAFIAANDGRMTGTGQLLASRPVVFVGLISYSLYLWHWPAIAFYQRLVPGGPDIVAALLILAASFVVATLSWWLIERPFRRKTWLPQRRQLLRAGIIAIVAGLAAGGLLDAVDGIESRVPASVLAMAEKNRNPDYRKPTSIEQLANGELLVLGHGVGNEQAIDFLLWGDSHAMAIAPEIDRLAGELGLSGRASLRAGTPPMLGVWIDHRKIGRQPIAYNAAVLDYVARERIPNVIIVGRWRKYLLGDEDGPLNGVVIDQNVDRASVAGAQRAFEDAIAATVAALGELGVHVYLVRQVPDHRSDIPRQLADRLWRGTHVQQLGVDRQRHDIDMQQVDALFARLASPNVTVIDPAPRLFDELGQPILLYDGKSLYLDPDHVSDAGAHFLQPVFEPVLENLGRQAGGQDPLSGRP
jgi:peptidoglycan/LPS O-acetylase OafA/YrhL